MAAIVEGFEGEYCILEIDGAVKDVPRRQVDASVRAGDVVTWNGEKWVSDMEETKNRSRQIRKLMDEVWED
ncbi:DUF3006 domain-containing protein [Paenibacillus sp. M1]|uniref:DUF3006 domain-containing protein n=1 Tax=Paenibacillus haidiansis TaxID=1574488 RepID=A0ABU7VP14_9BACL